MVTACPTVEILKEGAFSRVSSDWDSLLAASYDTRFFLTSTWHRLWWDHFGGGDGYFVTARDGDALIGLLPLQILEGGIVTLTGDWNVSDYMDGLACRDDAQAILRALWETALSDLPWRSLDLHHVPSGSPTIAVLGDLLGDRVQIEEEQVCPVALLCNSWDGYLQMLSKKQRHEIRRKLRRATDGAEWSYRTAATEDDIDRDMPVFFRLHELSAREKARFMTPDMRQYFVAVARTFLRAGNLRLSVFRRAGVDIAATMSFLYRDRYLLYNSGYDPSFAAHSPGIAAVALAMQQAIEEKAVAFDFLSGDEPYKYQFGATNTYTCRIRASR
ncbi:MAG TPA: GNAT family N-acetyltransferase [Chloroflexota bacterium]|nr:GNAT family N-acetyltransferase [Chloroflexota bacterium]